MEVGRNLHRDYILLLYLGGFGSDGIHLFIFGFVFMCVFIGYPTASFRLLSRGKLHKGVVNHSIRVWLEVLSLSPTVRSTRLNRRPSDSNIL